MESLPSSSTSTDVFSLTDQVLSDKLQFIEEVGFGNWGSVWLAQPKHPGATDQVTQLQPQSKMAVKLVHRSKTSTTAARVKSLWNEMKIVRTFKNDPHPSIVPFYSFIITPSYALITMAYLPTLVPVEVSEPKARDWLHSLLSGVKFLHERGVVHNDIKPANILLSPKNVPVLVDFGFAERYDMSSPKAFHSNLSYGTPEYLSPERARGLPHDTRKSDVWSLGITFFEILVGRTPFEHSDGEQFTTKEDLEKYWARTLKGKWVGEWSISSTVEQMLRRMISPNADLRCTAAEAMLDAYWKMPLPMQRLRKSSSLVSSVVFEKDPVKLKAASAHKAPRATAVKGKENVASSPLASPPGLDRRTSKPGLRTAKSQPKMQNSTKAQAKARVPPLPLGDLSPIKGSVPSAASMASSPTTSPLAPKQRPLKAVQPRKYRDGNLPPTPPVDRPTHVRHPRPVPAVERPIHRRNISAAGALAATAQLKKERSRSRDLSSSRNNSLSKGSQSARDRVKDWEREKERLREMARLEEIEKDRDEQIEEERAMRDRLRKANEARERARGAKSPASATSTASPRTESHKDASPAPSPQPSPRESEEQPQQQEKSHIRDTSHFTATGWESERELLRQVEKKLQRAPSKSGSKFVEPDSLDLFTSDEENEQHRPAQGWAPSPPPTMRMISSPDLGGFNTDTLRSSNGSPYQSLRHSIKRSIDKGISFYKTSVTKRRSSLQMPSCDDLGNEVEQGDRVFERRESWEDDELIEEANSSLPVVRHAVHNDRVAQDNRADRMSIWLRNVEQVVEDARQNFASSMLQEDTAPLPALPAAPLSRRTSQTRSQRSSRLPRKILAANEIFSDESMMAENQTFSSFVTSVHAGPSPEPSPALTSSTDGRALKRMTLSSSALETPREDVEFELDQGSPSKRKEKSKSHSNLLHGRQIAPIEKLELEIAKRDNIPPPPASPPISNLDRSMFIATPPRNAIVDDLAASPLHVEPYPQRPVSSIFIPDSPQQRRVEGVYDRFLMATSGVKRVGKGYQSEYRVNSRGGIQNSNTVGHASAQENIAPAPANKENKKYHTAKAVRRKMPPPVSSEDLLQSVAASPTRQRDVDELGIMTYAGAGSPPLALRDHTNINGKKDTTLVRRALNAFAMPSKTVSRRLSRLA